MTDQMALAVLHPAALRGRATATPSGKFWMPIPRARFRADSKVADLVRPEGEGQWSEL